MIHKTAAHPSPILHQRHFDVTSDGNPQYAKDCTTAAVLKAASVSYSLLPFNLVQSQDSKIQDGHLQLKELVGQRTRVVQKKHRPRRSSVKRSSHKSLTQFIDRSISQGCAEKNICEHVARKFRTFNSSQKVCSLIKKRQKVFNRRCISARPPRHVSSNLLHLALIDDSTKSQECAPESTSRMKRIVVDTDLGAAGGGACLSKNQETPEVQKPTKFRPLTGDFSVPRGGPCISQNDNCKQYSDNLASVAKRYINELREEHSDPQALYAFVLQARVWLLGLAQIMLESNELETVKPTLEAIVDKLEKHESDETFEVILNQANALIEVISTVLVDSYFQDSDAAGSDPYSENDVLKNICFSLLHVFDFCKFGESSLLVAINAHHKLITTP